jgi:hypothetical protein
MKADTSRYLEHKLAEKVHKLNCTNPYAPNEKLAHAKCNNEMDWWPEGKCNMSGCISN